jgi:hypothetical protein
LEGLVLKLIINSTVQQGNESLGSEFANLQLRMKSPNLQYVFPEAYNNEPDAAILPQPDFCR